MQLFNLKKFIISLFSSITSVGRLTESFLPNLLGHNNINHLEDEKIKVVKNNSPVLTRSVSILDNLINRIYKINNNTTANDLIKYLWGPVVIGLVTILLFFGVFGIWAAVAPLDGAVVATGEVVLSSNKQTIQHLEGGIINKILIKEGDLVTKNQPLIYLNDTSPKANLSILQEKIMMLISTEARLLAIKEQKEHIVFPTELVDHVSKEMVTKIIENQERLFYSHKKTITGQINIIKQRIEQLHHEINGLIIQLQSAQKQQKIINEELSTKKKLLKDGYISKPYLMSLEKQHIDATGRIGHYQSLIAQAKQKITENELEIINMDNNVQDKINLELKETHTAIADLKERIIATKDVLERTVIKAPLDGIVTGLKYHTYGGVIEPGAHIMNIVPVRDDLMIDVKIQTRNIEALLSAQKKDKMIISDGPHKGLKVKVRLSAYSSRKVGLLEGIVTQVSADAFSDQNGMRYYLVRVVIPKTKLSSFHKEIQLYPGMPAEVYIITQSRTLLNYLSSPITGTFNRALREN